MHQKLNKKHVTNIHTKNEHNRKREPGWSIAIVNNPVGVDLCIDRLNLNSGYARAVLINSGQANACTGARGLRDSVCATNALAEKLGLKEEEVLICSTGVIGESIPLNNLLLGLDPLIQN